MSDEFPIIDSHIHLYAESHISHLAWTTDLPQGHVLNRQNSVNEYLTATGSPKNLKGFIFLETDRKTSLSPDGWSDVLDEVDFLSRIASGVPRPDEGYDPKTASPLVLAIIPWAPIPAGPAILSQYLDQVRSRCDPSVYPKVKGFRYLVQDKPAGVMLQPSFMESLLHLGSAGFTFDLGVDAHGGGLHQLEEACSMLERLHSLAQSSSSPPKTIPQIIINHLCKPNLRLSGPEALSGHPEFTGWSQSIRALASFPTTSMKLSGLFSELPPQSSDSPSPIDTLIFHTKPWLDVVFDAFGPDRILFGSDWPVCNMGGPGPDASWTHWVKFVGTVLDERGLSAQEKSQVWAGTAARVYGVEL